jgi:hypothetical protein
MMDHSERPRNGRAGCVTSPGGVSSILGGARPARSASFFTTRATSIPDKRPAAVKIDSFDFVVRPA